METSDKDFGKDLKQQIRERSGHSGRALAGLILVGVGAVLLIDRLGLMDIPYWIFSWEMLLIAIGLFIGARHSFRNSGWIVPVIIGSALLIDKIFPELAFHHYMWPILIIAFGVLMIVRPPKKKK